MCLKKRKPFGVQIVGMLLAGCLAWQANSYSFDTRLDVSTRADYRSGESARYQYRLRFYPQLVFSDTNWSLNGFAVTGDEFASSYNTFGADEDHRFYLRRIYLRHETQNGKTEFGSIPPYKGRVSSTGLSKDGWITGIRQVYNRSPGTKIEWVIGQLTYLDQPNAFSHLEEINYLEFELSSQFNALWGYEFGMERMVERNFARGELRHQLADDQYVVLELVNRLDNHNSKVVLSLEGPGDIWGGDVEYFWYYSYTSRGFGARAELTEDFVDYGHAMTLELDGAFLKSDVIDWFTKLELNEGQQRFQLGLKAKL